MATSRQFTYSTTSPPSGTTKTGSLWVGTQVNNNSGKVYKLSTVITDG